MNAYTTSVPDAHRDQKRSLDPLELELQIIVSHHVCMFWELNQVLCRSSMSFNC